MTDTAQVHARIDFQQVGGEARLPALRPDRLPWSPEDDGVMRCTLIMGGYTLYLEAYRVAFSGVESFEGLQQFVRDEDADRLGEAFASDGPWETFRFEGADWAIFASPSCQ